MILGLLAVEAEADVVPVVLRQRHRGGHDQRDPLVRGTEQHVVRFQLTDNRLGVKTAPGAQLTAGLVAPRVASRRLAAALVTKSPNVSTCDRTMNSTNSCLYASIARGRR